MLAMTNGKNWNLQLRKHSLYSQKIRPLTESLFFSFHLSHFSYFSIDDKGYSSCISTNHEWMEFYLDQELFCHNPFLRKPGVVPAGVYFTCSVRDPGYHRAREKASDFGICDSLVISENLGNKTKGFSFGWNSKLASEHVLVNELPVLKRFCRFFEEEAGSVIDGVESDPILLLPFLNSRFDTSEESFGLSEQSRAVLFSQMGVKQPKLSTREKECLRLCIEGESARSIAHNLSLSRRTVESYLDNIKVKMNCYSKSELIKKSLEYYQLGIL